VSEGSRAADWRATGLRVLNALVVLPLLYGELLVAK
jgi:hypothetical protein